VIQTLKIVPILIVAIILIVLFLRSIGRVWINHRVKMALLGKLERRPDLLHSFQELQELLDGTSSDTEADERQNLTLTGVILAGIGIACVIGYSTIGSGRWAVGAYWGGVTCVAVGFVLALFGVLTRLLSRTPIERRRER